MAGPRQTVAFEVYVLRGHRWEINARFGPDGRHAAVRKAKDLNRNPGVAAVKVVREIFDSLAEISEEHIVYKTPHKRPATVGLAAASASQQMRYTSRRGISTAPRRSVADDGVVEGMPDRFSLALRALFATFLALIVAALATALMSVSYGGGSGVFSAEAISTAQATMLVAVFSTVFLVVAVVAAGPLFPAIEGPIRTFLSRSIRPDLDTALPRNRPIGPTRRLTPRKPKKTTDSDLSEPEMAHVTDLKDYLRKAAKPLRGAYNVQDSFIRFGVNLFAAGACEALCQHREVEHGSMHRIMVSTIRALGVGKDQAHSFASNYVEYLISDPRYMEMFCSGRQAILAHLERVPQSEDMLCRAMDGWATPLAAAEKRLVTVMFTRISNYDDLVADHGDEAAQHALHIHNQVVGRALVEFGGKRIKQIQNGTMAAFMDAGQAVMAAVAIRDRLAQHNARTPQNPVKVRIGLNSGEPVAEGNDLFGVTVQLAARIAATADNDQVIVSQAVRDEAKARTGRLGFRNLGSHPLKGFSDPQVLYEASIAPVQKA